MAFSYSRSMPLVLVRQKQLSAIFEIRVFDQNNRLAEIGQREEELVFHLPPVPIHDLVLPAPAIKSIGEKLLLLAKFLVHEAIDKCHIVVELSHFEDLLAPQSQLFVPVRFSTMLVAFIVVLAEFAFVPAVFDIAVELDP